ncbi:MAG: hypothetical protein ACR2PS_00910 [Pseudomonadales bacterium]
MSSPYNEQVDHGRMSYYRAEINQSISEERANYQGFVITYRVCDPVVYAHEM